MSGMSEITLPQNKKPHSGDQYVSGVNFRLISWMWWVIENKQLLWVVTPITLKFWKRFLSLFGEVKDQVDLRVVENVKIKEKAK